MKKASIFLCLVCFSLFAFSQTATKSKIITGADRMEVYLPLLKGKNVAVFANQTSIVGYTHLVDTLLKSGIKIVKIFGNYKIVLYICIIINYICLAFLKQ